MRDYMLKLGENIQPTPRKDAPRVPGVIIFVRHFGRVVIVYSHGDVIDWELECVGHDGLRSAVQSTLCEDGVWFSRWAGRGTYNAYLGEHDYEFECTELVPCTEEMWEAIAADEIPCDVEAVQAVEAYNRETERLIEAWEAAEAEGRQRGELFAAREAATRERGRRAPGTFVDTTAPLTAEGAPWPDAVPGATWTGVVLKPSAEDQPGKLRLRWKHTVFFTRVEDAKPSELRFNRDESGDSE